MEGDIERVDVTRTQGTAERREATAEEDRDHSTHKSMCHPPSSYGI